jgi:hypothetical protein
VTIVPPLAALRLALLADAAVVTALGDRVYVGQVPGADVGGGALAPTNGCLLRASGGSGTPRTAPILASRVDVHAYGPTTYTADLTHYAVYEALRRVERLTIGGTLLHSCLPETGPIHLVDPSTEWPEVVSTWALLAAEAVPA